MGPLSLYLEHFYKFNPRASYGVEAQLKCIQILTQQSHVLFFLYLVFFIFVVLIWFLIMSLVLWLLPVATPQPSLDPLGSPLFLLLLFFNSSSRRFRVLLYSPAVTAPTLSSSWANEAHRPPYCFSADATFDHPSICELSCLYNRHFRIIITNRCVV